MKVELVTLHRITNYGSLLQTYATQTAIERMGHDVEVLDFVPDGMTFKRACWPNNNSPVWKKVLKFLPLFAINLIQFNDSNRFLSKYIRVSKKRYGSYGEILRDIPEADAYVSGSDQVWNTQNNNPKEDLNAYYLGFVPEGKRRIAYAGSFGKNVFTDEEQTIIKNHIFKYDCISVREDDGLKILERFGYTDGIHVVDPTLLLTGQEWIKFASSSKKPKPGYVFVYNLNRNSLIKEIAKKLAEDKSLRIINFADSLDFIPGAENRVFNTALDFINHIAYADYVITDSFHGTAFSINLNKQFITVKAPRYNSRIESILRLTGLLDSRLVSSVDEAVKASEQCINYVNVNEKIDDARQKSYIYLQDSLNSKK